MIICTEPASPLMEKWLHDKITVDKRWRSVDLLGRKKAVVFVLQRAFGIMPNFAHQPSFRASLPLSEQDLLQGQIWGLVSLNFGVLANVLGDTSPALLGEVVLWFGDNLSRTWYIYIVCSFPELFYFQFLKNMVEHKHWRCWCNSIKTIPENHS